MDEKILNNVTDDMILPEWTQLLQYNLSGTVEGKLDVTSETFVQLWLTAADGLQADGVVILSASGVCVGTPLQLLHMSQW